MKIMAVDNNPKDLIRLANCLKEVYPESEIEPFFDPMLAVKYAFNNPVDVIFTEIAMRRIDGIQVKNMVHKQCGESVSVVFVTNDTEADEELCGIIPKPVSKEKIRNIKLANNQRR